VTVVRIILFVPENIHLENKRRNEEKPKSERARPASLISPFPELVEKWNESSPMQIKFFRAFLT
jgi:hypothetical protein